MADFETLLLKIMWTEVWLSSAFVTAYN